MPSWFTRMCLRRLGAEQKDRSHRWQGNFFTHWGDRSGRCEGASPEPFPPGRTPAPRNSPPGWVHPTRPVGPVGGCAHRAHEACSEVAGLLPFVCWGEPASEPRTPAAEAPGEKPHPAGSALDEGLPVPSLTFPWIFFMCTTYSSRSGNQEWQIPQVQPLLLDRLPSSVLR